MIYNEKRKENIFKLQKSIDSTTLYDPEEAIGLAKKAAVAKFDETIEVHIRPGVMDVTQISRLRGAVVLPHGTGKTVKVFGIRKGNQS